MPRRKRQRMEAEAPAPAIATGGGDLFRAFGRCRALLDKLLQHDDGWVFSAPVDARALGLHDYYTVVRDPMDLSTVLNRLEGHRYADPHAFASDVRLMFSNAMSYNNEGDPVYNSAVKLSEIFEAGWAPVLASLPPPPPDAERKAALRDELSRMPVGVLESAAEVLKTQGACLVEKGSKVEVDLNKANAAMLDKLGRLIAEHRLCSGRRVRPDVGNVCVQTALSPALRFCALALQPLHEICVNYVHSSAIVSESPQKCNLL
jgi:hypothetical protein